MTSYQKLKNRIAELEADRLRLLEDSSYYLQEVLNRRLYIEYNNLIWFGDHEPTGEITEGIWASLLKDQDNDTNHQKG